MQRSQVGLNLSRKCNRSDGIYHTLQKKHTRNCDAIPVIFSLTSSVTSPAEVLKSNRSACRTLSLIDELVNVLAFVCQIPTTVYRSPEDSFPRGHLNPPFTSWSRTAELIRLLMLRFSSSWNSKNDSKITKFHCQ